jgi:hypothetical protein
LLHTRHTDTAVNERAGFGHRNRLKLSKGARVDKKRKSERKTGDSISTTVVNA